MADTNNVAPEMKKSLSLFNFFTIGFGAIIGTGWVLLVGDWMILGGGPYPAMIAFAIGALFLVPIGMVFGELTAAIPISGALLNIRTEPLVVLLVSLRDGCFFSATPLCARGKQLQFQRFLPIALARFPLLRGCAL